MNSTTKIQLTDLNPHLICVLCGGYLIDATTIIECIHSFCRTCIIRYLESSKYCPICDVQVHKTRPLTNVRSDKTLQTLVYKLVPGLFKDEMRRRREFYAANQNKEQEIVSHSVNANEERGEVKDDDDVSTKSDDEKISLCLQHCAKLPPYKNGSILTAVSAENDDRADKRYLLCPAGVTIGHLKKLLRMKFDLSSTYRLEIFYSDESLRDVYTLLDVAHIYAWRRVEPLKLYYIVYDQTVAHLHLTPPSIKDMIRNLPETPAEGRKRKPNRKRKLDVSVKPVNGRKVHEISDSDPSDNESSKREFEPENPDSGVIVLSSAESDVQMDNGSDLVFTGSEKDQAGNTTEKVLNETEPGVSCTTAKDTEDTTSHIEDKECLKDTGIVGVTDSEKGQINSRKHSPEVSTTVVEPTTSMDLTGVADSKTVPNACLGNSHLSQNGHTVEGIDVTLDKEISEIAVSPGKTSLFESSSSERAKTPKSKSINEVVSKIKAKSSVSDQVIVLDIMPGIVPMDIAQAEGPDSGNENKQPTLVIKKALSSTSLSKTTQNELDRPINGITNNNAIFVPCDSTTKPKTQKVPVTTKPQTAKSKLASCLQDSLVGNTKTISTKPKKGKKTKLSLNQSDKQAGPAAKKAKVDNTVDLTRCNGMSTDEVELEGKDIEVVSFELSTEINKEPVVILS